MQVQCKTCPDNAKIRSVAKNAFAVRIAKNAMTLKKYTAGVRFDRRSLMFRLDLQRLDCLGRQALQNLHASAQIH